MLDLHPVAALPEHERPRTVDELVQPKRVRERDDLVVSAVHDEVGTVIARMRSSSTVMASTLRCRGAGNIEANASWTPGRVAASRRKRGPALGELDQRQAAADAGRELRESPSRRPTRGGRAQRAGAGRGDREDGRHQDLRCTS